MSIGSLLVDIAAAAVKKIRNRPKAVARRKAREARKAAERAASDAAGGEFFPDETEAPMLSGYKTYIGILTAAVGVVLGWLGLGEAEAGTLATQIIGALDQVLTVAGLLLAAYGRAKAS